MSLTTTNNSNNLIPSDHEMQVFQVMARNAASSQLYRGVGGEPQIIMIMLAARELGIPPMVALNGGVHCIQGKIELSARLMGSLIRRSKHSFTVNSLTDTECVIEGKRSDNGDTFTSSFTIQEANRAGLVRQGSNWIKYPKDMLYARALSRLARQLFPDVIGTAYVEGEIREARTEKPIEIDVVQESEISPEEEDIKIKNFLNDHPEEERIYVENFIKKKAEYYKKRPSMILKEYEGNKEKFTKEFLQWRKKHATIDEKEVQPM